MTYPIQQSQSPAPKTAGSSVDFRAVSPAKPPNSQFSHSSLFCSFLGLLALLLLQVPALAAPGDLLIPHPQQVKATGGKWVLPNTGFVAADGTLLEKTLDALAMRGFQGKKAPTDAAASIQFLSLDSAPKEAKQTLADHPDGYVLWVKEGTVLVLSASTEGHYAGLQTLLQLIDTEGVVVEAGIELPVLGIIDWPRFQWRGFMLDESRHFSGMEAVKRLLDAMAYYKLNVFHWHLTDDKGWRIEIKKYPKLTTHGSIGDHTDPKAPAQFYTQEEIKEIVAYAKARGIKVMPEIDMPGHATPAVRAYPEHNGGGSDRHPDFTFNPASPATEQFLRDILTEVASLFPDADAIHFGGDEVHFGWGGWPDLADVKRIMAEENLPDLRAVEKRFGHRIAKHINELGYKAAGWDEIAEFDIAPEDSILFWWRHDKPAILSDALNKGRAVVLCPRLPLYFDFLQNQKHQVGRRWNGINPLENVYAFPDSLAQYRDRPDSAQILGVQANLWTETTQTQERRDFMTFPRLLALAEVAWTTAEEKDYARFEKAVKSHLPILQKMGLKPYNPFEDSPEIKK